ncbi:Uncharacterised protein [Bordetella pertussis]|nr:Uncharacterised protein [Bordetella pertussis]
MPDHSARSGRRLRVSHSSAAAGTAASRARPSPTSSGESSPTASRVMGRVRAKTRTPINP